ncbi:M15 family metallopeptidase [Mycolicibacterium lutetiense]
MPEEESVISAVIRRLLATVLAAAGCVVPLAGAPVASARPAAEAGLVDVRSVVPDAVVDLRYATADNFVGQQLYPAGAPCLVHESMVPGLMAAAATLRPDKLVFWDCYRPHEVQVRMFEVVSNPNWVARPSAYARSHEAGRSIDVTIAGADMGTGFDDFTPRSLAYATDGVSPAAQANRARLREAMKAGGLTVYSGEWWHFDGPGAADPRPYLDVPLG